jgi:hypothetical protein
MTIQQYIELLIGEGHQVTGAAVSDDYLPIVSSISVSSGTVTVSHRTFEAPDVCEFYSTSGELVARARGFTRIQE